MPFNPEEASLRSQPAVYFKPDQVYKKDEPSAIRPMANYLPRHISERIVYQDYQNNDRLNTNVKDDKDGMDEIKNRIQKELMKTRSQIKLIGENTREKMNRSMKRSRNTLQTIMQLEHEDIKRFGGDKYYSLIDLLEASINGIEDAVYNLREETSIPIRSIQSNLIEVTHLNKDTKDTLARLDQKVQDHLEGLVNNTKQQMSIGMKKLAEQYFSIVNELDTKIEQNYSHASDLIGKKILYVRDQERDIVKEMKEKTKVLEIKMRNMFNERKQNLKDAYNKARTTVNETSIKDYLNQQKKSIIEEMNKIKDEMKQKLINEVGEVIKTVKSELESNVPKKETGNGYEKKSLSTLNFRGKV